MGRGGEDAGVTHFIFLPRMHFLPIFIHKENWLWLWSCHHPPSPTPMVE